MSLAIDVYTYERKGFTQFTAIGPTYNLVGADFANDLGAQVAADFASSPGVIADMEAFYASQGWPLTGIPAFGIPSSSDAIAGLAGACRRSFCSRRSRF